MPSIRKADLAASALALILSFGAPAAMADPMPPIRPDDRARLDEAQAGVAAALLGAFRDGAPADVAVLTSALSGPALPAEQALDLLPGEWNCRVIKVGGLLPLTVYQPFRCVAGPDGSFQKITGSQRKTGTVGLVDGRLVYLGTGYIAGDPPVDYADLPAQTEPAADPQRIPEAGLVEMVDDRTGRIIFPRPALESDLDLLLLTR